MLFYFKFKRNCKKTTLLTRFVKTNIWSQNGLCIKIRTQFYIEAYDKSRKLGGLGKKSLVVFVGCLVFLHALFENIAEERVTNSRRTGRTTNNH